MTGKAWFNQHNQVSNNMFHNLSDTELNIARWVLNGYFWVHQETIEAGENELFCQCDLNKWITRYNLIGEIFRMRHPNIKEGNEWLKVRCQPTKQDSIPAVRAYFEKFTK